MLITTPLHRHVLQAHIASLDEELRGSVKKTLHMLDHMCAALEPDKGFPHFLLALTVLTLVIVTGIQAGPLGSHLASPARTGLLCVTFAALIVACLVRDSNRRSLREHFKYWLYDEVRRPSDGFIWLSRHLPPFDFEAGNRLYAMIEAAGVEPDTVLIHRPGAVQRTSSGNIGDDLICAARDSLRCESEQRDALRVGGVVLKTHALTQQCEYLTCIYLAVLVVALQVVPRIIGYPLDHRLNPRAWFFYAGGAAAFFIAEYITAHRKKKTLQKIHQELLQVGPRWSDHLVWVLNMITRYRTPDDARFMASTIPTSFYSTVQYDAPKVQHL